jgi:hypothetical protein
VQQKCYILTHSLKSTLKISKKTWSVIKEIIGSNKAKQQLPDFFRDNNQEIRDYIEIANGFNNFFFQIGPKLASEIRVSNVSFETFLSEKSQNDFKFSRISETDILQICDQLKPKLSSGIDFIYTI